MFSLGISTPITTFKLLMRQNSITYICVWRELVVENPLWRSVKIETTTFFKDWIFIADQNYLFPRFMKYSKVISADWLYIIPLRGSAGHSENESRKYGNGFKTRVTIRQNWPLSLFEAQIEKILPGQISNLALLLLRWQKLQIRGWVISDRFTNCKDIDGYIYRIQCLRCEKLISILQRKEEKSIYWDIQSLPSSLYNR